MSKLSSEFQIFSVPGQVAGLDGFVGNADFSLNLDAWSEADGQYLPAEEYPISPDAPGAVQHRAPDGDGAQGGVHNLLEMTLQAFAMVKELRVFQKPGPGVDASMCTQWCSVIQSYIDAGQDSFAPLKAKLQELLSGNPSLANAPGYFAGAAPAVTSAFGVGIDGAHRQSGFCHEAGFVLGQGTKPTLVNGP
jgi:hypothetical protein